MKEENPVKVPEQDELEMMGKGLERGVPWKPWKEEVSRRKNWSEAPNGSRNLE